MDRTTEPAGHDLVELGVASADTLGRPGPAWEITGPDELHGIQDR